MVLKIIVVIESLIILLGAVGIRNLLSKNEIYETAIGQFYAAVSFVLSSMKSLDRKQMFETDDEVGTIFIQLRDILYTLDEMMPEKETNEENRPRDPQIQTGEDVLYG